MDMAIGYTDAAVDLWFLVPAVVVFVVMAALLRRAPAMRRGSLIALGGVASAAVAAIPAVWEIQGALVESLVNLIVLTAVVCGVLAISGVLLQESAAKVPPISTSRYIVASVGSLLAGVVSILILAVGAIMLFLLFSYGHASLTATPSNRNQAAIDRLRRAGILESPTHTRRSWSVFPSCES